MDKNRQRSSFPKRFLWGASVSAHQVEGGNHNQWTVWELQHAKARAAQAEYEHGDLPSWDDIKAEATQPDNYVSGDAANHYNLYKHDLDIAKKMHMNAFRFSIEWSRIEPEEGVWNAEAIAHYHDYIDAMIARGLEPVATLFHFTLPVWFAEKGGFEKKSNIKYFERFAEKVMEDFGSSLKIIVTINEPEIYIGASYLEGRWPPGVTSKRKAIIVVRNLIRAHNNVAAMIHAQNRRYKVGIAKSSMYFYSGDDARLSHWSAHIMQYVQDDYILKRVAKHSDFIGVNFYFGGRIYGYKIHNPDQKISDIGWDMSPDILQQVLERLHDKYKLPILITENGVADASDTNRRWWLAHSIVAMQKAMAYGVDLWGYLHWSLIDNFEWAEGKWPRFGLIAVDYKTQKRRPRPSAVWYAGVIKKMRGIK